MKKYGTMNFKDIKKFIKKFSLNSFNSKSKVTEYANYFKLYALIKESLKIKEKTNQACI